MKNMILIATIVIGFGLTGCETINGAGKDLQKAGAAVQRAAN